MKSETFKGEVASAYGNQLPKAIQFSGAYQAFENAEEVKTANQWPNDSDIVDFVNTRTKNNERQKAMTAALEAAGITKPDPNDPVVVAARMLRDIEKLDMPADQKAMIAAVLQAKQKAGAAA